MCFHVYQSGLMFILNCYIIKILGYEGMNMKVAVLISTYNGEKYLLEQIESLLSQEGDFEIQIIIRDDGSSDETLNILKKISKKTNRIIWYQGENIKPAKSYIDLILNCGQYDFYCFCDQDDYWDSDKIKVGINALKNIYDPCIYYCNAKLVDDQLNTLGSNVYKKEPYNDIYTTMCASNVIGCTMIMNHALIDYIRKHESPQIISMHDSYMARVCLSIGGRIIYDKVPHMKYRQHSNNVIGIKSSFDGKIKQAANLIMSQPSVTIDEQASEILRLYFDDIPNDNRKWLMIVSDYRRNILTRIYLALSKKTKYKSLTRSIEMRLAILLGNR